MLRRTTHVALTAAALLAVTATAATTAQAKPQGPTTWKVTEATHTSSATYRSDTGSGSSSMKWHMIKPKSTAPNTVAIGAPGPLTSGYGVVNVFGDVVADAQTDRGSCHLAGDSNSDEYGYDVPWPVTINMYPPKGGKMEVGLAAHYAKIGSTYFGSECGLGGTNAPEKQMKITTIPAKAIKGKRIVMTWKGSGGGPLDTYTWSTRIVMKRVKG